MKIGIISDTHDNLKAVKKFVKIFKDKKIDLLLHAGDIVSPFVIDIFYNLKIPQKYIFGNNDGEKLFLSEKISKVGKILKGPISFKIENVKFAIMHEPFGIESLCKSGEYNVVIYGHTHEIDIRKINKTIILNPGEGCGYLTGVKSALILNTEDLKVEKIIP